MPSMREPESPSGIEVAHRAAAARRDALEALRDGQVSLRSVLIKSPPELATTDLYDIVLATPGIGHSATRTIFERAGLWPHIQLASSTKLQRQRLIDELP
jgi:hypothetical protein